MKIDEVAGSTLPDGTYPAIVGGYISEFKVDGKAYSAKFPRGVRGIGIRDTIWIRDGKISSNVLGDGGELN